MPTFHAKTGETFEVFCDQIEVTSLKRPDTSWVFTDARGHEHHWYVEGGGPDGHHISASLYSPEVHYITPTLIWIKDGVEYWPDGEPYDVGHHECRQCGEHIEPGYRADDVRQYIAGLKQYLINGEHVTREEFERRFNEAQR